MLKYLLLLNLILLNLSFADDTEVKQKKEGDLVIIEDKSGLSQEEVIKKVEKSEQKKDQKRVDVKDVIKLLQQSSVDGTVNLSEIQAMWEDLSPKADKYDWVQTKSGEWFKGEIKALYRDRLEFDSDEIGIYTFDFDDVVQIKSHSSISVNIDQVAIFQGIVRYKDKKISIYQGNKEYTFDKDKIVSLAPEGKSERTKWNGKITVSLDSRTGNTNQMDYTAKATIKRTTSKSRLVFDYLGRYSTKSGENVTADNRINQKLDLYVNRKFFWTPIFSELYQDEFKNINLQATAGVGLGYTLINQKGLEWDVSGGPAYIYTKYNSVENGAANSSSSAALELSTDLDYDITKKVELLYSYKLTLTNKQAGTYKHHMVTTLENEITDWLDFDITYIWDFILEPEKGSDGTQPDSNDHQFLLGLGVEF